MTGPGRLIRAVLAGAALILCGAAQAGEIRFDSGWREQRFSLFSGNRFGRGAAALDIRSEGAVSLLWTALPEPLWPRRGASWDWRVGQSVPPTDLTRKGGDDRNIALYFLFLPEEVARAAQGRGVRALLNHPEIRVLMYVWGGAQARGAILPSPYLGARGRTVVLRSAGTGAAREEVDLARDHLAAFGTPARSLVGLAVSADSDDTASAIDAQLSGLRLTGP